MIVCKGMKLIYTLIIVACLCWFGRSSSSAQSQQELLQDGHQEVVDNPNVSSSVGNLPQLHEPSPLTTLADPNHHRNSDRNVFENEDKWQCQINNQSKFWSNPQQIAYAYKAAMFSSIVYLSYEKWSEDEKKMLQNANLSLINKLSFLTTLSVLEEAVKEVDLEEDESLASASIPLPLSTTTTNKLSISKRLMMAVQGFRSKIQHSLETMTKGKYQHCLKQVKNFLLPTVQRLQRRFMPLMEALQQRLMKKTSIYVLVQSVQDKWKHAHMFAKNLIDSLHLEHTPLYHALDSLLGRHAVFQRWRDVLSSKESVANFIQEVTTKEGSTEIQQDAKKTKKSIKVEEYKLRWFLSDFHYQNWHDTEVLLAESETSLMITFRGSDCVADVFTNSQRMFPIQKADRFPSYVQGNMLRGMYHAYASVDAGKVMRIDDGLDRSNNTLLTSLSTSPIAKLYQHCLVESGNEEVDSEHASSFNSCEVQDSNLSDMLVETALRALDQGYEVIVTGHSLGGALGMLLSLDLMTNHRHYQYYPVHDEETEAIMSPTTSKESKLRKRLLRNKDKKHSSTGSSSLMESITTSLKKAVHYDSLFSDGYNYAQEWRQRRRKESKRRKRKDERILKLTSSLSVASTANNVELHEFAASIPLKALLQHRKVNKILDRLALARSNISYEHHNNHNQHNHTSHANEMLTGERDFQNLYLITFGEPEFADVAFFESIFTADLDQEQSVNHTNSDLNTTKNNASVKQNYIRNFFDSSKLKKDHAPHYHSYIGVSAAPKCEVDLVSQILTYLSKYIGHQVIGFQQEHQSTVSSSRHRLSEESKAKMLQDQSPISLHKDEHNEDLVDIDIVANTEDSMFAVNTCVPHSNTSYTNDEQVLHNCDQHLSISQQKLEIIAEQYHQLNESTPTSTTTTSTAASSNKLVVLHELLMQQRVYINSGYAQNNIEAHSLYNYLNGVMELGKRYNRDYFSHHFNDSKDTGMRHMQSHIPLLLHSDLTLQTILKLELVPRKASHYPHTKNQSTIHGSPSPLLAPASSCEDLFDEDLTHCQNQIVGISLV